MRLSALMLAPILLTGCAKDGPLGSIVQSLLPKVTFDRVRVDQLDFQGVQTTLVFNVQNPNPIGLHLANWSWQLSLGGVSALDGKDGQGLDINANGASKLRIPIHLVYNDVAKLVTNLRESSEVPFAIAGSIGLHTPLGVANIPLHAKGTFPTPQIPKITLSRLEYKGLSATSVDLAVVLSLSHKFAQTMPVEGLQYGITLDGGSLISGKIAKVASVAPGKTAEVSLPIRLDIVAAGASLVSHLTQKSPVRVSVQLGMNVGTPFGSLPLKWQGDDLLSAIRP